MIRFIDVERQKAWMRQIELRIDSVGEPQETQYGLCQVVQATDGVGRTEPLNYFFEDEIASIDPLETGLQWYDVKWDEKNGYFRCKPALAKPKELKSEGPDWDFIARGKIRHGIVCAMLQAKLNPYDIVKEPELRNCINNLVDYIQTGELNSERLD